MATNTMPEAPALSTEEQSKTLVKRYMYWSMGFGALPVPGVDVLLIGGTQLNMLRNMSHIYHIDFHENRGKSIVTALIGSIGTPTLAFGSIGSLLKMVPLAGPIFGAVAMPATAGAVTYAIGKVFIQHFESGGTFLDLDPEKVKAYFQEQYSEGKKVVDEVVGSRKVATAK